MKKLENKPFLLEENIKKFFNSIPIPSYVWQKKKNDFILIDYNKAAEKVTNGKIKDYLNKKASEVHNDRVDIVEAIKECYNEKKIISKKSKYLMKPTRELVYVSLKIHFLPPDLIIVHIKDITKWKLAEKKLKDSEERYKMLFESSPMPIALTNLNGTILDCNKASEKQFGYLKEDLAGKNYLDLRIYSPNLIPIFKTRLSQLVEGKPIKPIEFEITKKDGSKRWVLNQMFLISLDDKPIVQSFVTDITERKNFEQQIQRKLNNEKFISTISSRLISTNDIDKAMSKSLLEMGALIGATRAYILLFNEENSLEFYLQEWCAEGIEPQMIDLTNINQAMFPWIFDLARKNEFIHIKDSSELPEEEINLKKELEILNINSVLCFPIKIKDESYGYIGFDNIHQISEWDELDFEILRTTSEIIGNALERKWAEETLKGSHQLLAGIISSLIEVIYLVDNHFNVIWANTVAKQFFGLQLTGKKCYKAFAHQGKPCSECIALKTFKDGKIHESEKMFTNLNGEELFYWYTSSTAGLNLEGETELAIMILRDLTSRKSMEEILIRKVEERTRELRESEEIYKKILSDLDVGFYKGEFKGKLSMHNAAVNKILGIKESQSLVGSNTSQFFINEERREEYYRQLLQNGYVKNYIIQVSTSNEHIISIQLNSHLIRDNTGKPKEVEGTIIKLTDY